MGRKQKQKSSAGKTSSSSAAHKGNDDATAGDEQKPPDGVDVLFYLRTKYTLYDKAEWWWLMDDSMAEIDRRLAEDNYVVIDGFLPREQVQEMREEVKKANEGGHMQPGVLAGGKVREGL